MYKGSDNRCFSVNSLHNVLSQNYKDQKIFYVKYSFYDENRSIVNQYFI